MSQNLTGSATVQASKAVINSLTYKNENISESIQPEMVKRTTLHPVYNDNDEIEERVYYTLHNDAAVCTYVSPHLLLERSNDEVVSTIPGVEEDNDNTIIVPIPPPVGPVYPNPPEYDPDDPDIDDEEDVVWPGGGGGGGGGGGSTDDDDDDGGSTSSPSGPRTNFDNYAAEVTNSFDHPNITSTREVTRWYTTRSAMTSAKFAMAKTRSKYKNLGWEPNEAYANLVSADDMYFNSYIEKGIFSIPKTVKAPRMFKDAIYLQKVTLNKAKAITDAQYMCENCGNLTNFTINESHQLSNATGMFRNCVSLKNVNFGSTTALTVIDHMFEGCKSPQINPFKFPVVDSARYALSGTTYKTAELKFPDLSDGSYMMYNCKNLVNIQPTSELATMVTGEGMYKDCTALQSDNNKSYFSLQNATSMYSGCKKLNTVDGRFNSLQNGTEMFKDCENLTVIDIHDKFPVLQDGTSMFENCKALKALEFNIPTLTIGNKMFKGCNGAITINVSANALKQGESMFEGVMPLDILTFDAVNADNLNNAFLNAGSRTVRNTEGSGSGLHVSFDADINVDPITAAKMFKNSMIVNFNNAHQWNRLTDASNMFEGCSFLTNMVFGEAPSLTTIDGMFKDCSSLKSITANFSNVIAFEVGPFENCPRLKTVNLTMDKLTVADEMFRNCTDLTEVNASFANLSFAKNMFRGCTSLKTAADTPEVTSALGMYQDTQIDTIPNMPNIMTGRQTFQNCKQIKGHVSASYPHLTNGINMFNSCDGITSASISVPAGADVRNMFALCPNITSITGVSFGEGVYATSLFMHSKVDYSSFKTVYNAIKNVSPIADVNGCVCHVGVKASVIAELEEEYKDVKDEEDNPLFYNWEGNQYALRLSISSKNFVMAVVN